MKTKNVKVLIAISFFLFYFLQNVNATIIYVDASNNTGIEDGSLEHPFNTVIEGIEAASEQDTVSIAHGTYNDGNILIEKAIHLIGEDMETTIINGELSVADTVGILPYTIQNLQFNRLFRSGYYNNSKTTAPLLVSTCSFGDYIDTIRSVDSTASLILANNIISDSIYIFNIACDHDRMINNCYTGGNLIFNSISSEGIITIKSNEVGGKVKCSSVSQKDSLFITDNIISDSLKVYAISGPIVTIKNNIIGNTTYLYLYSNHGMIIDSNLIENGDLISFSKAMAGSSISGNDIQNGGIQCTAKSGDVIIKGNSIHPPTGETGIDVKSKSFGRIAENEIILDYVAPSGLPETEDTTASCGIRIITVAVDSIYNNTIEGGTYGIYAKSVAIRIGGNSIELAHHGVYTEAISCKLHSNHVVNCEGNGMILDIYDWEGMGYDSSYFYLFKNNIESNKNNGLVLRNYACLGDSANMATSGENTFKNNDGYDLYIETPVTLATVIKAQRNIWDYTTAGEINDFDIYDGKDNPAVSVVDFVPFHISGIEDDLHNNMGFEIYPNPASEVISLSAFANASADSQPAVVEIYDLNGKILIEKQIPAGTDNIELDVSSLKSGVYFCRLLLEEKSVTKKLIIK